MFTGIVREVGTVVSFNGTRLVVETGAEGALGDSVAIAGVCLTVIGREHWTHKGDVRLFLWEKYAGAPNAKPAVLFVPHSSSIPYRAPARAHGAVTAPAHAVVDD